MLSGAIATFTAHELVGDWGRSSQGTQILSYHHLFLQFIGVNFSMDSNLQAGKWHCIDT